MTHGRKRYNRKSLGKKVKIPPHCENPELSSTVFVIVNNTTMHPDRIARLPKASRPKAEKPKAPKESQPEAKETEAPKVSQTAAETKAPKKALFDDSDSDSNDGGVELKVNEEYAKRFEHNKKREERQRRMYTPSQRLTHPCPNTTTQSRKSSRGMAVTNPTRNPRPSQRTRTPSSRRKT